MCNSTIQLPDGRRYSCGKCEQCHNRYIQHWTFRLKQEMRQTNKALFLTLTYDYNNVPMYKGKYTLDKQGATSVNKLKNFKPPKVRKDGKPPIFSCDYQKFIKRLRKALPERTIKYVCAGEYGTEKGRPHYHLLLFGIDVDDFNVVNQSWGLGQINIGNVTESSIAYVFKYSVKGSQKTLDWRQKKQFVAMSKGLGEDFAFDISYQKNYYINSEGRAFSRKKKIRSPKEHFKNKLDTLLKMPYYKTSRDDGNGTVMMSIPRFYLDAAQYDKTELTEMYMDKINDKYIDIPQPLRDVLIERERNQRKEQPDIWARKVAYTLSKEKI